MKETRTSWFALVLGALLVLAGCSDTQSQRPSDTGGTVERASASSPFETLVPLGPSGDGRLTDASLEQWMSGIDIPRELVERGWHPVVVRVHGEAHGQEATLAVTMWYNADTRLIGPTGLSFPDTLVEGLKHPDWAWGQTDVRYHLQDGVLLIDEADMK